MGIGTSNPLNLLQVDGSMRMRDPTYTTTRDYITSVDSAGIFRITDTVDGDLFRGDGSGIEVPGTLRASNGIIGETHIYSGTYADPINGVYASAKISTEAVGWAHSGAFTARVHGSAGVNLDTYAGYFNNTSEVSGTGVQNGIHVIGHRNYFSGTVGIGTISPAGILDVQGGTAAAGNAGQHINIVAQNGGAGGASGGNINLTPGDGSGGWPAGQVGIYVNSWTPILAVHRGSSDNYAASSVSDSTPNRTAVFSNAWTQDGNSALFGFEPNNSAGTITASYFGAVSLGGAYNSAMVWGRQTGANSYQESMRLLNGNVGIGTTSPSRLLHVNGPMRITASALPGTPGTGDIAVDSGDSNKLKWYDGSAWQAAGGLGGGGYAGTVDITGASYSITSGQNGYYFTFNGSAAGTINLPALSGLSDGFQVTVLRQVAKALTLTPNGADTFPSGITTIEMQGQNIASVTLTKLGSKWNLTNTTDDCVKGQACWGTGNLYVGTLNGKQYFTTPGGCTDSGTPTCAGGTDTVTKAWATTAPESNTDLPISEHEDGQAQSATLAGYATANAAKYCENMTYAGYSDWYLPANSELNMLYQSRGNIRGFVYSSNYWSSTEDGTSTAWYFVFTGGFLTNVTKPNALYVRCVRRF